MSQHYAKYMQALEAATVFIEQFSFMHLFIFFQAIQIGPDISKNGYGVFLELRIHEKTHGKLAWLRAKKIYIYLGPIGYWFLLRLQNAMLEGLKHFTNKIETSFLNYIHSVAYVRSRFKH